MRYVVTEMRRFPSEYLALPIRERALVDAIILDTAEKRAKEQSELEKRFKK